MKFYFYLILISTFCLPIISMGQSSSHVLKEKLENSAKKDLVLNELNISNDTLNIVSAARFLYYPFGKHKSFAQLKAANFKYNYKSIRLKNQLIEEIVSGFQMYTLKSYINFFLEDEDGDNRVMIIRGEILDSVISLKNGVVVGMDKQNFFQMYFNELSENNLNVINFISVVEGITHTYTFHQNKLQSIKFYTDYMIM